MEIYFPRRFSPRMNSKRLFREKHACLCYALEDGWEIGAEAEVRAPSLNWRVGGKRQGTRVLHCCRVRQAGEEAAGGGRLP